MVMTMSAKGSGWTLDTLEIYDTINIKKASLAAIICNDSNI